MATIWPKWATNSTIMGVGSIGYGGGGLAGMPALGACYQAYQGVGWGSGARMGAGSASSVMACW